MDSSRQPESAYAFPDQRFTIFTTTTRSTSTPSSACADNRATSSPRHLFALGAAQQTLHLHAVRRPRNGSAPEGPTIITWHTSSYPVVKEPLAPRRERRRTHRPRAIARRQVPQISGEPGSVAPTKSLSTAPQNTFSTRQATHTQSTPSTTADTMISPPSRTTSRRRRPPNSPLFKPNRAQKRLSRSRSSR